MIDLAKMPRLGFGLMRLPEKSGKIDLEQVKKMVDLYMASGFNYFDTAYVYHGGHSEEVLRSAVVERYPRDSFYAATKLPAWKMTKAADRDRIFEEQLRRAGLSYYDFYLLHSVEEGNYDGKYSKYDCFSWALKQKAEGKIRHFGFSFHGKPALLRRILREHPEVEFVQIQLNYIDWTNPEICSGELYSILQEAGLPVIVMEPVKGGSLASLPPEAASLLHGLRPQASTASWALRFVGSLPGVMTILSGMSDEAQMKDNLATFSPFVPLSEEEQDAIGQVRSRLLSIPQIACTRCRYCVDGCPAGIEIPSVFKTVNALRLYPGDARLTESYTGDIAHGHGRAQSCLHCGQCEAVCPQHLPIVNLMEEAARLLDS